MKYVLFILSALVGGVIAFYVGETLLKHGHKDRILVVSGEGVVSAVPDVFHITFGVVSDAESASKATVDNKVAMNKVFKVLSDFKIAEKDIVTTNFSLTPRYNFVKDLQVLIGYRVSNDVSVTVRDLDKAGDVLEAVSKDGRANRISSLHYEVSDKNKYFDLARASAAVVAVKKAQLLADSSKVKLGKVLNITESNEHSPSASGMHRMSFESADARMPLAKGERQFKVTVNVTFALDN